MLLVMFLLWGRFEKEFKFFNRARLFGLIEKEQFKEAELYLASFLTRESYDDHIPIVFILRRARFHDYIRKFVFIFS